MKFLVLQTWLLLLYLDIMLRFGGFKRLHQLVQQREPDDRRSPYTTDVVCQAVDLACLFYLKRVFCLQRSAAATLLLRRYGHPAEMVIGAELVPFRSHAWVEVDGEIVNDKPYMLDIYRVLERC